MCNSKYFSQINIFIVVVFIFISAFKSKNAVAATLVVTNVNDSGIGSLRGLVDSAALGDTIRFDFSTNGIPIILLSELVLTDSLHIYGNGISNTILDGGGTNRIFNIPSGFYVNVRNLKITNGYALAFNGGAILNGGRFYCDSCLFESNTCDLFGGCIHNGIECRINNCTFKNNFAGQGGGAFYSGMGPLIIHFSTFTGNHANNFGGAIDGGDSVAIFNSTFSGNSSGGEGGALVNFGTMSLQNSTVAFNATNGRGGGIVNMSGYLSMTNTIISNNFSLSFGQDGCNVNGTIDTGCRNNIIGDTLGFGFIVGNNNLLNIDPTLGALAFNGGLSMTHALLCGSPAINSGIVTSYNTFDQRGQLRIYPDIGAFEFKDIDTAITVNKEGISAVQLGASYEWLDCNTNSIIVGQTLSFFAPLANGSYAMIITNNGCTDTSTCVNITTVGIENSILEDKIELFPNPVHSDLTIKVSSSNDIESISIFNIAGQIIDALKKSDNLEWHYDVSSLPSGLYILEIRNFEQISRMKFLKD